MSSSGRSDGIDALVFFFALALFAGHELDAVARHEWRMLPILWSFDDEIGRTLFVLAHVPLFTVLFWMTASASATVRRGTRLVLDGFFVVHAALHLGLSGHALYEFRPPVETITVYGAALAGAAHAMALRRRGGGLLPGGSGS